LNNLNDKRKTTLLQWATLAVALGRAGENNLAHLGLSARSTKTGKGRSGYGARRRHRSESSEPMARLGQGGGARRAPECGGPDSRCVEVRGSPDTLVRVGAVGAEGRASEGPL
jgi:hypothetical protein